MAAEVPAGFALSEAQHGAFRSGIMPAMAGYRGDGRTALGLRMRAGVLRDGPAPGANRADPGAGGLGSAGLAVRLGAGGGWIELVGGIGLTGTDLVPAFEAGVGWTFAAAAIDFGPSVRVLRLQARDTMAFGSADVLLVGVDVRFGRDRARSAPRFIARPAPTRPASSLPRPATADTDRITDRDLGCLVDGSGCEGELAAIVRDGLATIEDDRIVLEERVLFDLDRARVRSKGREVIAAIARMWRAHPEWLRITIEGHADTRGREERNIELSRRRAERAREVLLRHVLAPDRIDVTGHGSARPRFAGDDEEIHRRNRRVEFVIERAAAPGDTP